jgi:hypothetical protein
VAKTKKATGDEAGGFGMFGRAYASRAHISIKFAEIAFYLHSVCSN